MEHAVLIIEGALHLHNLVNYREKSCDSFNLHLYTAVFQSNLQEYGIIYIVVGNYYDRPGCRLNMDDTYHRTKRLQLRDNKKCSLVYHNIHRLRQEE